MVSRGVEATGRDTHESSETQMADSPSPRKAKAASLRQRLRLPFFLRSGATHESPAADGTTIDPTGHSHGRGDDRTYNNNTSLREDGPVTSSSSEETFINSLYQQTRIVTVLETLTPSAAANANDISDEALIRDDTTSIVVVTPPFQPEPLGPFCASSALLRHSYLERMCGVDTRQIQGDEVVQRLNALPEDPSPQESIECVFAAQMALLDFDVDEDEGDMAFTTGTTKDLPTPSSLQQCLLKNRLNTHRLPLQFLQSMQSKSPRRVPVPQPIVVSSYTTGKMEAAIEPQTSTDLKHTTKDDGYDALTTNNETEATPTVTKQPPCHCKRRLCPTLTPENWPQRPLLMRPTPYGGTVVKGIRFAGQTDYLWSTDSDDDGQRRRQSSRSSRSSAISMAWPDALQNHWSSVSPKSPSATASKLTRHDFSEMCPHCMILPINNGKELPGESLVIDFESNAFDGSILIRLKDCQGTTCATRENPKGYFDGLHRRYQVIVRGRFKREIPWTECFSGFQLEQPPGKLPPKWIVNGTLNVVRFFAPLLQTSIDGPRPYCLTPLGSTPQALIVSDDCKADRSMESSQEEPKVDSMTLLGHSSNASSSLQRARYRKKHFDKMYTDVTPTLTTDPKKVYTFEFLQHLLSFDDFSIELGSIVGSVPLKGILNGQPLQIMASHKHPVPIATEPNDGSVQNRLWSFDLWHELLIADALRIEKEGAQGGNL